jgi:anti-sigma factor RsiW
MTEHPAPHLSDEMLNEYLDEALPPAAHAAAEAHLAACAACGARLAALRVLFAGLEALPEAALAHDLASVVVQAVRRTPAAAEPVHRPGLPLVIAAQALAAVAALAVAWPHFAPRAAKLPNLALPAVGWLNDLLGTLQGAFNALSAPAAVLDRLQGSLPSNWFQQVTAAAGLVPLQALLAVAAGAGLLWLLTNVWLLQHRPGRPNRRTP